MGKSVVVCVVSALVIMASPISAAPNKTSSSGPYVFVGFTTVSTLGGVG